MKTILYDSRTLFTKRRISALLVFHLCAEIDGSIIVDDQNEFDLNVATLFITSLLSHHDSSQSIT